MRKYFVGALVGFLLALPFTAFGAQIQSMVGEQVKNEYSVIVDGKMLDKKAIAINGTSYAPLRSIAGAIGYDIAFTNNTVVFSNSFLRVSTKTTTTQILGGKTVNDPAVTGISIEGLNFKIDGLKLQLKSAKGFLEGGYATTDQAKAETERQIKSYEDQITQLEAQKTDLEAQATLAPTPTP